MNSATTDTLGPSETLPFARGVSARDRDNLCRLGQYLFTQVSDQWPANAVPGITVEPQSEGEAQLKLCVYPIGLDAKSMRVDLPTIRVRGISPSGQIRVYSGKAVVGPNEIVEPFKAAAAANADTV